MVKSETRRDAEILVRNPSPRLFGEKFRDSKKGKTNHEKTRLRDLSKTPPRFRDPAKIFPRTTFFDVLFATPIIKRKKFNSAIIAVFFRSLSHSSPVSPHSSFYSFLFPRYRLQAAYRKYQNCLLAAISLSTVIISKTCGL